MVILDRKVQLRMPLGCDINRAIDTAQKFIKGKDASDRQLLEMAQALLTMTEEREKILLETLHLMLASYVADKIRVFCEKARS